MSGVPVFGDQSEGLAPIVPVDKPISKAIDQAGEALSNSFKTLSEFKEREEWTADKTIAKDAMNKIEIDSEEIIRNTKSRFGLDQASRGFEEARSTLSKTNEGVIAGISSERAKKLVEMGVQKLSQKYNRDLGTWVSSETDKYRQAVETERLSLLTGQGKSVANIIDLKEGMLKINGEVEDQLEDKTQDPELLNKAKTEYLEQYLTNAIDSATDRDDISLIQAVMNEAEKLPSSSPVREKILKEGHTDINNIQATEIVGLYASAFTSTSEAMSTLGREIKDTELYKMVKERFNSYYKTEEDLFKLGSQESFERALGMINNLKDKNKGIGEALPRSVIKKLRSGQIDTLRKLLSPPEITENSAFSRFMSLPKKDIFGMGLEDYLASYKSEMTASQRAVADHYYTQIKEGQIPESLEPKDIEHLRAFAKIAGFDPPDQDDEIDPDGEFNEILEIALGQYQEMALQLGRLPNSEEVKGALNNSINIKIEKAKIDFEKYFIKERKLKKFVRYKPSLNPEFHVDEVPIYGEWGTLFFSKKIPKPIARAAYTSVINRLQPMFREGVEITPKDIPDNVIKAEVALMYANRIGLSSDEIRETRRSIIGMMNDYAVHRLITGSDSFNMFPLKRGLE